ncbi:MULTISPECIES: DUF7619 domain-containing protein [Niastella]|uniref:T9SS type A sorting domain-containing protein n=1 Tax=Niastella soli TaxID=2821487 RepID=A0ABS3YVA7_9BACT|nr:T9SS type A sorting domain-containing protein [Niastella soli]MBO9201340.1 T9SS type A sorting domain-containing protein [Niastella soli]
MKRIILSVLWLLFVYTCGLAQTPGVKWSKYIASDDDVEGIFDGKQTTDKGYILVGYDTSYLFPKEFLWTKSNFGTGLIIKLDSAGNKVWSRWHPYRGGLLAVTEVSGGYTAAGYSGGYPDTANFYIGKLNTTGGLVWEYTYGGSGEDKAYSMKATSDGYILAGFSNSSNGDVVKSHKERDAWLVKLNDNGLKQWAVAYGGSQDDTAYDVVQMPDGGFLVCGVSSSVDGDIDANKGSSDGWVFKVNSAGALQWKKNFGGNGWDVLNRIIKNTDNTYTLSGYSSSNNGDVSGAHGNTDVWVIKIDDTGTLLWSKVYGGSRDDASFGLQPGVSGGYFVTGFTESSDEQITAPAGGADCWTLRLDDNGGLLWQKSSGTVNDEYAMVVMPTNDAEFAIAGFGYPLTQGWQLDEGDGLIIKYSYANTIKGTVFFDANNNGVKDAGENSFDKAMVTTQKTGYSSSGIPYNGAFSLDVDTGSFATSLQLSNPYYTVVPATHASNFSNYYNVDSFGFAVQAIPNKKDLFVSLNAITPARPGFNVQYRILYANLGTVTIPSGTVQFVADPKFSIVSALPLPTTTSGNTLTWNYSNLNGADTGTIWVNLQLAAPPAANIGDTLRSVAVINPVAGDETPADDTEVLKQLVVGSFDPNDKTEANAGVITPDQVNNGEYLHYLIRFQNTGTDTAFNVTVRDTLENRLDWNSLQMISASHPYQLTIENGNKLTWRFNDIKLPYTAIDEPASHGYIAYRIKPVSTVQIGDVIQNTAGIYFDFNLPVATNIEKTVVMVLTPLPVTLTSFQAALKDAVVRVTWTTSLEEDLKQFEVERSTNGVDFTTIGIVLPGGKSYLFTDKQPLPGYNYYRLKSVDRDGAYKYSSIVMVNVKNDGSIISSLYPNPASGSITLKLQGVIEGNVMVQVLDQQGRPIVTKQLGMQHTGELNMPIVLNGISKGTYVLRILVDDKAYLHKLLVQ